MLPASAHKPQVQHVCLAGRSPGHVPHSRAGQEREGPSCLAFLMTHMEGNSSDVNCEGIQMLGTPKT